MTNALGPRVALGLVSIAAIVAYIGYLGLGAMVAEIRTRRPDLGRFRLRRRSVDSVLAMIDRLDRGEQLLLAAQLTAKVTERTSQHGHPRTPMECRALGHEVWEAIDIRECFDRDHDSWSEERDRG
jgi:hypothetical protein